MSTFTSLFSGPAFTGYRDSQPTLVSRDLPRQPSICRASLTTMLNTFQRGSTVNKTNEMENHQDIDMSDAPITDPFRTDMATDTTYLSAPSTVNYPETMRWEPTYPLSYPDMMDIDEDFAAMPIVSLHPDLRYLWHSYRIKLPGLQQTCGTNQLRFHFEKCDIPARRGHKRVRPQVTIRPEVPASPVKKRKQEPTRPCASYQARPSSRFRQYSQSRIACRGGRPHRRSSFTTRYSFD
ncbi:hypothetical protein F4677DRAFT_446423 [Hypoxylon crocopeplum]|nr:hypothetical protein F4677DRAFT_446423 [Hypoxylon crocopeplum]